jgi:CheY-like chemotaxis protein
MNQRILQKQLEQAGHQCSIANNGLEAVTAYEKGQFDLILMDREMPVIDGIEATKKIRLREKQLGIKEIPIIGLSAYARQELVEEAKQVGMNDYVTKPYSREILIQKIKQWTSEPTALDKSTQTATSMPSPSFFTSNPVALPTSSESSQTLPPSPR